MSRLNLKSLMLLILLIYLPLWAEDTLVLDPDRAVELALKNNLQLQQTQEKILEAAAGKAVAFGSFLPQISASGSYTRLGTVNEFQLVTPVYRRLPLRVYDPTGQLIGFTDSIPLPLGADTVSMPLGSQNNYLFRASIQQTLFTWGKLINAYRIAGLTLEIQKAAYEQAKQQLKVQTLEAFYQALLAQKSVALLQESQKQLERHLAQVERLYNEGLAGRLDLMRARVGLTNLTNQVAQAENGAGLALLGLCNLLALDPDTPVRLEAKLDAESLPVDLAVATDSALQRRPELIQLRQALRVADLGVRIARTANLPILFAAANYDYKRPVGFNDQWGKDWNATLGVSLPLFTGLANYHKLQQAQSRYRQAVLSVGMVEQAVRLEVEATAKSLAQEWRNIRYQEENVNLAEEAFRLAEQRYENGLLSNLEYLDIQLQLTQSRLARLSALANYQIARARFLRATGKF